MIFLWSLGDSNSTYIWAEIIIVIIYSLEFCFYINIKLWSFTGV